MAGDRRSRGGPVGVGRIYEKSRLEVSLLASAYEIVVPIRRLELGGIRESTPGQGEVRKRGVSVDSEECWREVV